MVSSVDLAIIGVLGPASSGRKAYSGPGAYDSYANLELQHIEILKGALAAPSKSVYIEISWPNNVELDELVSSTPVGARVVILGDQVEGALEAARTLEDEEGVPAVADIEPNLVALPSYGLLVEATDGGTYAPLWDEGPLLLSGADALDNFGDAVSALRASTVR